MKQTEVNINASEITEITDSKITTTSKDGKTIETLTFIPFCKKLIIPEMLDQTTISWLNNYNKQIRNLILPTFTNDLITQNWILFNTEEL